jgi:hypothetical protein
MATLTETVSAAAAGKGKRTCYTQADFEKMIHQGICYSIPIDVLHTIRDLDIRIKQKAIVQQKHFENKRFHVPKNNGQWKDNRGSITGHEAKEPLGKGIGSTVSFKPTASLVNSGGATEHAKIIQRIKLNLNKLSQQNYDKLQKEIVEDLEVLLTDWTQTEETRGHELINDLFHIMSKTTDVKMSDLYAHCYFHWANTFQTLHAALFQQVINEGLEEYCRQLTEFRLMDADRDGEAFCKYNRFVSEHRGRASFLIHYAKQSQGSIVGNLYNVLKDNLVSEIMEYVQDTQATALKKMFVDEWIEHVVLFLNVGGSMWVDYSVNDYFVKIQTALVNLSQTDVKQWPNMTVRSKFKLQGVLKDLSSK